MSVTCVPIYGLMFKILTRFHTLLTLARRVFIAILLFDVALFWRAFHINLKSGREGFRGTPINLKLISIEYGLTISGHVTVLRQWPLDKNTDYIININIYQCLCNDKNVRRKNILMPCTREMKLY